MKRDLKINFGILEQIRDELYHFMRALENMKASVNNIDNLLANASGKSVEAISEDKQGVITAIDTYKEQVNDVYVLISDYIGDMTSYIRPINEYALMRVDRDDIWWNISQIEGSNSINVNKPSRYGTIPMAEFESNAANELIADQIEADIAYLKTRISSEISTLWQIHDQKIAPFEDTDDHFKSRSETLYDRYTSWEERNKDIMLGIETGIYNLFAGAINGLVGIVEGFITLGIGSITYIRNGVIYLATAPFGTTPEDVLASLDETHSLFASVLKDPALIIEGMAQNISDTYEEKGIMYSVGAVVPEIIIELLLTKGLGKIGKLANFGDSFADMSKYADEIVDAADIAKKTKLLESLIRIGKKFVKEPFDADGNLLSDVVYYTGEFGDHMGVTDDLGRLVEMHVDDLKLSNSPRPRHNPNTPGKLPGDQAGHIIADQFGGSPELDNLVSQLTNLNKSEYRKLEIKWADALKDNKSVTVNVKMNYAADGVRPVSFDITYSIDGKEFSAILSNI
ncbi:DNA/RNA non-specific endonuclease [Listeria monocytogenes]|nr:DNA/RNA non-specific endonuclease [Listeria monocytogenes]EIM0799662.1 DNA/RNA non-specific endonuclease [Listeria monocytogenes]EIM1267574.1 DNA/RNA non-specific endonuclease [Listeria monocytogenes]